MLTNEQLKKELDRDQYVAVTAPLQNMLCIANAGSGKTRVLTYRIAKIISDGQPEDSVLMVTFTRKAANEMMGRIKKLLGKEEIEIMGGTFHSMIRCHLIVNFSPGGGPNMKNDGTVCQTCKPIAADSV